jgi:hypothetical protein
MSSEYMMLVDEPFVPVAGRGDMEYRITEKRYTA